MIKYFGLSSVLLFLILSSCGGMKSGGASPSPAPLAIANPTSSTEPASVSSLLPATPYSGRFPSETGEHLSAQLAVAGQSRHVALSRRSAQANLPLIIVFHGTSGKGEEILDQVFDSSIGGPAGAIYAAPQARSLPGDEWDHGSPDVYWETTNDDPATNPDLLLVRAIIQEARARYQIDPRRVYLAGYSNGGFFALLAAMTLRDQVAAYAIDAAGLVRCPHTGDCEFRVSPQGGGSGTSTCQALKWESRCHCDGSPEPVVVPATGRKIPGYISHSDDDDMVSVYYACALADQLQALGYPFQVRILNRAGGHIVGDFLLDAWNRVLSQARL